MAKTKWKNPRGGDTRLYWEIQDSPAWQCLPYSTQAIFFAARRSLTKHTNGNIHLSLSVFKERGMSLSSSTLARALRELLAVGLIAVTREGGKVSRGQAIPVLYRFTDEDSHEWRKPEIPAYKASNEWRAQKTHVDAIAALKAAHEAAAQLQATKTKAKEKNLPVRKSKRVDSKIEVAPIRNSKTEPISGFQIQTRNDTTQSVANPHGR